MSTTEGKQAPAAFAAPRHTCESCYVTAAEPIVAPLVHGRAVVCTICAACLRRLILWAAWESKGESPIPPINPR